MRKVQNRDCCELLPGGGGVSAVECSWVLGLAGVIAKYTSWTTGAEISVRGLAAVSLARDGMLEIWQHELSPGCASLACITDRECTPIMGQLGMQCDGFAFPINRQCAAAETGVARDAAISTTATNLRMRLNSILSPSDPNSSSYTGL